METIGRVLLMRLFEVWTLSFSLHRLRTHPSEDEEEIEHLGGISQILRVSRCTKYRSPKRVPCTLAYGILGLQGSASPQ